MKKQRMRHARRPPYAQPSSKRLKNKPTNTLTTDECRVLMTDPQVLELLDDFEQRFYQLYMNGLPLPGLAKFTLGDVRLAKLTLATIERKIWLAAPRLKPLLQAPPKDSVEDDYDASAVDADIVEPGAFEDESYTPD